MDLWNIYRTDATQYFVIAVVHCLLIIKKKEGFCQHYSFIRTNIQNRIQFGSEVGGWVLYFTYSGWSLHTFGLSQNKQMQSWNSDII